MSSNCNHDCFNCKFDDCITNRATTYYPESSRKNYVKNREKRLQYSKDRAERLKEAGICVNCGSRPIAKNSIRLCMDCLLKERYRLRRRRREVEHRTPRIMFNGVDLCSWCGKRPPVKGQRLCESCLETARKTAAYNREHRIDREKMRKDNEDIWRFIKMKNMQKQGLQKHSYT